MYNFYANHSLRKVAREYGYELNNYEMIAFDHNSKVIKIELDDELELIEKLLKYQSIAKEFILKLTKQIE